MRVSDASFFARFLRGFRDTRVDLARAVEQLADGKRVRRPSDDPAAAHESLALRAKVVRLEGFLRASRSARFDLATVDATLGEAFNIVTDIRAEAMAGASNLLGDVNDVRAQKIDSLRDRLLDLANTTQNGRHLFSGTQTLTPAFDAAGNYQGNGVEVQAPIDFTEEVGVTLSGGQVFQGPAGDLFQLLDDLATALRADDTVAIQTAIADLDGHLEHLAQVHADIGLRMQRIDAVVTRHEDDLVQLRGRISGIEDAYLEETALALSSADQRLQALSGTAARVLGRSLFDFLG